MELLRGLCALRHKAGARGDPLLEVLVLHQLLDRMVLKDAETGLPQVMHRELVGRIGEQDVGRLHGAHERGREDGIHLRILEPLFQLIELGAALVTQRDVRAAADVKALQIAGSQAVADEMELKGFHAKTPLMSYLFLC